MAPATTLPIVNKSKFSELTMPLPPLAEQKRIAALLDEADALRRKRREAIAKLDMLLQSVFLEMFGENENEVLPLSSCSEVVSGVTKGRKFGDSKTIFLPYIRVANVQDGFLDLTEIKKVEALPSDLQLYRLHAGDVLLTEGGDYDKLGRGAMWHGQVADCIHQNHIFRVRVNRSLILPEYFAAYLQTRDTKRYFLQCAKRTTNLASINMTQLKALPVQIPTLREQQLYVERYAQILTLKRSSVLAEQRSNALFCALQHRFFSAQTTATSASEPSIQPCLTLDF